MPAIPIGILSYVVASLFLSIYDFSSLAILHCFILNEDQDGKIVPPEALKGFLDLDNVQKQKSGKDNKKIEGEPKEEGNGKKEVVNNME